MSNTANKQAKFSPGVLSMLPMFYVGWSDSVLSPSEMELIHKQLNTLEFLTEEDRAYLIKWTDPKDPPSPEVFKEWVREIRGNASNIEESKKTSLVNLGIELAKSSIGYQSEEIWKSPKTKSALIEIENALGVSNQNSQQLLLNKLSTQVAPTDVDSKLDPQKVLDVLDGENKLINDRMRKLLRDPSFGYSNIKNKEEYRLEILRQTKELAKQGLSGYAFPRDYGGGSMVGEHIAVFEMLGFHDLSLTIKFGVQFGLFGGALYGLGTAKHHKKYLQPMINADLLGCFAMTETGHGSNVRGLETTAHYNKETKTFTLHTPHEHASKEYIGNAIHSEMAAVFCQLIVDGENHGVHCLLVTIRDKDGNTMPGIRVKDCGYKMGLNGVDNGMFWFDKVEVPKENLLNRFGDVNEQGEYVSEIKNPSKRFFTMLGALVTGRVSVGLAGVSASKSALTIAIKYGLKRRQFSPKEGSPETLLMDYPSHQNRLLPRLAKTYAYHFGLHDLAKEMVDTPHDGDFRSIETKAAGLKSLATWHTTDTIQECREACGGKGYLEENRLSSLKADTDIFTTFEGDNTVLMQLVAKGVLTEFRKSLGENNFFGIMKYLSNRLSKKLIEINPKYASNTSTSHLLDPRFHAHAFRYREEKLTLSISNRMRKYLGQRIDPNDAYMRCQLHMLALGTAYSERLSLIAFQAAIEKVEDNRTKEILEKVCQLYALTTIQEAKGFFLENEYLGASKTKAIRRMIAKLNQDLRPLAGKLVDSFGIPEELLGADIILYN